MPLNDCNWAICQVPEVPVFASQHDKPAGIPLYRTLEAIVSSRGVELDPETCHSVINYLDRKLSTPSSRFVKAIPDITEIDHNNANEPTLSSVPYRHTDLATVLSEDSDKSILPTMGDAGNMVIKAAECESPVRPR